MSILSDLEERFETDSRPFLIGATGELSLGDVLRAGGASLSGIRAGDVVALVGGVEPTTINTLLRLSDLPVVIVPLTGESPAAIRRCVQSVGATVVIEGDRIQRRREDAPVHPLYRELARSGHAGLVLFSSGMSGEPKMILHDFERFLRRYRTPRPPLRVMSFLSFDHIGGLNTLFHTLYSGGVVVVPSGRAPAMVFQDIEAFGVEVLPTTPTFLRMLLAGGFLEGGVPGSLRIVTYGAERMDPVTLQDVARLLPGVDLRQTYGLSELGILRVRSRARDSLFMRIGGEGVATRVVDGVLQIRAELRMLGYLNHASPFDEDGWYDTGDLVETDGDDLRIIGRKDEVINVGGMKVHPSQIESEALACSGVCQARARGIDNPITGQHIELVCEARPDTELTGKEIRRFLRERLPREFVPHRVRVGSVERTQRFKSR